MSSEFRHLRAERIIATAEEIAQRVESVFPDSGLGRVAEAIAEVAQQAVARAEKIARPDWWLRSGLILLALLVLGGATIGIVVAMKDDVEAMTPRVLDLIRIVAAGAAGLGAVVVFLVTLETRIKRGRAIKATHELRALAHIIDMHQMRKNPTQKTDDGSTLSRQRLTRYLRFCTEMLALVSKIGHLYVQDFPDGTTLAAVDQVENLATGLSQKIWQKIMILEDDEGGQEHEVEVP